VRGGIAGAKRSGRHSQTLLVFESIQERQHHERVGLEPGPLADRLGLLQSGGNISTLRRRPPRPWPPSP
jgi:hypothetical protein